MSLSILNSTNVPLSEDEVFTGSNYDNILDFAQIAISIKCDTGYVLTYIYSQNKVDIDYQTSQTITVQADTQFYNVTVKDRYFKLQITANDGDMTVLNVQTIYKTSTTYAVSSGPGSNVTIIDPVDVNGYVQVTVPDGVVVSGSVTTDISGQTVDISGQTVDISGQTVVVDISGQTVDISGQTVVVDISGQTVDISGQTVVVDISGQTVDISGQTVVVDISGQKVDISGQTVDISGQTVVVDISGQTVDISGQTVVVDISGQKVDISGQTVVVSSTDITSIANALSNQRITSTVWNNISVVQNGQSNIISPGTSTYCNTTLSCYGTSSQDATIAVQFSNNGITFYTTQYQYTLTAGNFGFSIPCSAYHIRLILLSAVTSTITAYIDIC